MGCNSRTTCDVGSRERVRSAAERENSSHVADSLKAHELRMLDAALDVLGFGVVDGACAVGGE